MYIYIIYIYIYKIYIYTIYIYYTLHLELGLSENRLPANLVVYHHVCYSNGMAIWRYTLQTDSMLLPRHPPWCGPLRGRSWNPGWGGGRWKANRTERHFEKKKTFHLVSMVFVDPQKCRVSFEDVSIFIHFPCFLASNAFTQKNIIPGYRFKCHRAPALKQSV